MPSVAGVLLRGDPAHPQPHHRGPLGAARRGRHRDHRHSPGEYQVVIMSGDGSCHRFAKVFTLFRLSECENYWKFRCHL